MINHKKRRKKQKINTSSVRRKQQEPTQRCDTKNSKGQTNSSYFKNDFIQILLEIKNQKEKKKVGEKKKNPSLAKKEKKEKWEMAVRDGKLFFFFCSGAASEA